MDIISSQSPNQRIAVMGGMFDPVHNGHLSTAQAVLDNFELDEVRLIPCGSPVHREASIASADDRISMLQLATKSSQLVVDERECQKSAPSYMFDTLNEIKQEKSGSKLFLVLGTDSFNSLPSWYRWQELFELAHLIVIARPGWEIDEKSELNEYTKDRQVSSFDEMCCDENGKVLNYSFNPLMIGSTQIRQMIKENKSPRYLLPDSVLNYIKEHNLYT